MKNKIIKFVKSVLGKLGLIEGRDYVTKQSGPYFGFPFGGKVLCEQGAL
jgi:hypothetical protein